MQWPLQDAKNRFSEVVKRAQTEGPQIVTLRGVKAAVVLSTEAFERLTKQRPELSDFLLAGPIWSDALVDEINQRDSTQGRIVEF